MAKELDKTTLTRLAWLTELRRQGHRQCSEGVYTTGTLVCALGLLRETALPGLFPEDREILDDVAEVGALAGLSEKRSYEVAVRNDGSGCHKHTFREIADIVEGWFPR